MRRASKIADEIVVGVRACERVSPCNNLLADVAATAGAAAASVCVTRTAITMHTQPTLADNDALVALHQDQSLVAAAAAAAARALNRRPPKVNHSPDCASKCRWLLPLPLLLRRHTSGSFTI